MSAPKSSESMTCPACGARASGRYCSECGAVLQGSACAACRALLAPGARFCHRCGTPVGASSGVAAAAPAVPATPRDRAARTATPIGAPPPPRNMIPWMVGALAFVVLVVIFAAQRAGTAPPAAPGMGAPMAGGAPRAPDISQLTPRERADRLFDRIMTLDSEGKRDSVLFFAPMALGTYESLGELDLDLRYDFGRVAEVSGNLDLAAAQADTILRQSPTHLLGLVLAMRVAERRGDQTRRNQFAQRLLAAESSERAKGLPEYGLHEGDLQAALASARNRR